MAAAVKFTRKTLPQKEGLGEKLAKKRISLGLDVKDIEKSIRIRAKYITAIENGNYTDLPPDVYVRGFITNYSTFLKLDPDKVLKLFERERGLVESVKNAHKTPVVKAISAPKIIITPKTITIASVLAFFLLIFIYIGWQVSILIAPPKLIISSPTNNLITQNNSVNIVGLTDPGSTVLVNSVEIGINQNGSFKEKINLQNGVNKIKVRSQNKLGGSTSSEFTVESQYKSVASNVVGTFELKIAIGPRSASVLVQVDGKNVTDKSVIMLAGVSQSYRANKVIKVITNDGGSVQATYNGQSIGIIGKDNESTTREFTQGMMIK